MSAGPYLETRLRVQLKVGSTFATKEAAQLAAELVCNEHRGTYATTRQETSKPLRLVIVCNETFDKKNAAAAAQTALKSAEARGAGVPEATAALAEAVAAAEKHKLCPFRVVFTRKSTLLPYRCYSLREEHRCDVTSQPPFHGLSRQANLDQVISALHPSSEHVHRSKAMADTLQKHLKYKPPAHTTQRARGRKRLPA